jgi:hypothetical protein
MAKPNYKLDIRSHTDSRASFQYNAELSDRRAVYYKLVNQKNSPDRWLEKDGRAVVKQMFRRYRMHTEQEHQTIDVVSLHPWLAL